MKSFLRIALIGLSLVVAGGAFGAPKTKKKFKKRKAKAAATVPAADASAEGYQVAYGMAGCGLGSMFFQANSKFSQIMAATTNATFGNQLLAITSGTSNCGEQTPAETAAREREVYLTMNLNTLSKEAAQGNGQTLHAFADVLGCAGDATYPKFQEVTKTNYEAIFNSNEPNQVLNQYLNVVRADELLVKSCVRLGV